MKQLVLFFILLSFSFSGIAQNPWQLKKNKNGVQIFTRKYPDSKFNEYKGHTIVNTTLERVKSVILDADNLKNWNYKTSKSKLLKKIDDNNYIIYLFNDMPWPVLNRDHISNVKVTYPDIKTVLITITPNNTMVPKNKGTVRITNFNGHWLLKEVENGVSITQQLFGDPGGGVPSWLVNTQVVKAPYISFNNLKELLEIKDN